MNAPLGGSLPDRGFLFRGVELSRDGEHFQTFQIGTNAEAPADVLWPAVLLVLRSQLQGLIHRERSELPQSTPYLYVASTEQVEAVLASDLSEPLPNAEPGQIAFTVEF